MGAGLAIAAEALALRQKLNHLPARILTAMALRALDRDAEPVYYAGHDILAAAAGHEPTDAGRKAAQRGIRQLIELGLLRRVSPAPNRNTRYFLLNDDGKPLAPLGQEKPAAPSPTVDTQRPVNGGHSASSEVSTVDAERPVNGGHSDTQRWTLPAPTVDTQRPVERNRELGGGVGGAPALPPIQQSPPPVIGAVAAPSPRTCTNQSHELGQRAIPCGACMRDRQNAEAWQNRPRPPQPHQCIDGHRWIRDQYVNKSSCTRCSVSWWHDEPEPRVAAGTTR